MGEVEGAKVGAFEPTFSWTEGDGKVAIAKMRYEPS